MKLKLNRALRASLLACYAFAAPVATTISTGVIVTGVVFTLAPQAEAAVNTWTGGGSGTNVSITGNWDTGIVHGTWMSTTTANTMLIDSTTTSGKYIATVDFSTMNLGGVIVTSDATDQGDKTYELSTNSTSDRNIDLGAMESDVVSTYAAAGAIEGATNFIISQDFNLGYTYTWATVTMNADLNAVVAAGSTFTINAKILDANAGNAYVSGGGIMTLNLTTNDFEGTGTWTVTGGSTLNLVSYGANLLTTTTAGSVALNNGTVSLATGSTVVGTIGVGADGGTIALTGVEDGSTGTITLNGTITYTDSTITALDLSGSTISVGEDLSFNFEQLVTNDVAYTLLTNYTGDISELSNINVTCASVFQTASLQIDGDTDYLQVVFTASGLQDLVWGGGSGTWSTENAWTTSGGTTGTFNAGDAVTFNTGSSYTVSLDGDVEVYSMSIEGENGWGLQSSEEGTAHTLTVGSITVNVSGTDSVRTGADVNITNVDTIQVTDGTFNIEGGLSNVGSIQVAAEGNIGLYGTADNIASITVADGGSFTLGDGATATNMGTLTLEGAATATFNASAEFTSMSIGNGSTINLYDGAAVFAGDVNPESVTEMYSSGFNVAVNNGSSLTLDNTKIRLTTNGAALTISGSYGGTFAIDSLMLGDGSSCATTVTVEEGATLHITGTTASTDHLTSSIVLGHWTVTNTVNVNGTMIAEAALTQKDGNANVIIGTNGTLELKSGLDFYDSSSGGYVSTITVNGTLKLGANTQTSDSVDMSVTMNTGGTIESTASTTVYDAVTYSDAAAVNFKAAADTTLTMATAVTGSNVSATIQGAGNVSFAAGATLNNLTVESGASLILSGTSSVAGTITNAGTLDINGSLSISNTIINTDGVLNIGSGTVLDITGITDWTLADGTYSYTLIDGGTIILDDSFSSDISSLFTAASLVGKNDFSFVDGVLSYTALDGVVYDGGESTLNLNVGTEVGGTAYADGLAISFSTAAATVNLTGDIAPSAVTIDAGIMVTLGSDSGNTMTSTISMGAGSTLVLDVAALGAGSSFGVTSEDSTLIYDLSNVDGQAITDDTRISGFTGDLVIRDGTFTGTSADGYAIEAALNFSSLTVEAGATFALDSASMNRDDRPVIEIALQGGDEDAATFYASNSSVKANFTLSGATVLDAGDIFNIYGQVSNLADTDTLLKSGSGTLTVASGNAFNFSGALTMEAGTLALTAASTVGSVTATGESTLGVTTSLTVGGTLTLSETQDIALSAGSSITGTSINNVDLSSMEISSTASSLTLSGTVSASSLNIFGTDIKLSEGAQVTVGGGAGTSALSGYIATTATEINIDLAAGSLLSQNISLWTNAGENIAVEMNISGSGTYELTSLLLRNGGSNGNAVLNIGTGSTFHITGTENSGTLYSGLCLNGGTSTSYGSTINIGGTMIVDSSLRNYGDASAAINVNEGGTLTLNRGTYMLGYSSDIAITVGSGATLELGNSIDDSGAAVTSTAGSITLQDGSTLTGNGATYDGTSSFTTSTTTTSAYNFTLADSATVNIKSDTGDTLALAGTISNTTATANITGGGTVAIDGMTTLGGVTSTAIGEDGTAGATVTIGYNATLTNYLMIGSNAICGYSADAPATLALTADSNMSTTAWDHVTIESANLIVQSDLTLTNTNLQNGYNVTISAGTLTIGEGSQVSGAGQLVTNAVGATLVAGNISSVGTAASTGLLLGAEGSAAASTFVNVEAYSQTITVSGDANWSGGGIADTSTLAVTGGTLTFAAGTVLAGETTISGGGKLSIAGANLTAATTLSGGSLNLTDGALHSDIVVAAAGSSIASDIGELGLNSTIFMGDGMSLSLSGVASVELGINFGLDLSDMSFVGTNSYDIFTGLSLDISTDDNWEVLGLTSPEGYDAVWTYDDSLDKLTLSFSAVVVADPIWNPETGVIGVAGTDYSTTDFEIDTALADTALLNTGEDGTAVQNLTISGDKALTIQGDGALTAGAITLSTDLTVDTTVDIDSITATTESTTISFTENASGTVGSLQMGTWTSASDAIVAGGTLNVDAAVDFGVVKLFGTTATISGDASFDQLWLSGTGAGTNNTSLTIATGADVTVGALRLSGGAAGDVALSVEAGASLTVTGTETYDYFQVCRWNGDNTIDVSGTLISEVRLSNHNGTATINVNDGGLLQLDKGLMGTHYNAESTVATETTFYGAEPIVINVKDGATLAVGNQESVTINGITLDANYDYATTVLSATTGNTYVASVELNMASGSTIMDNGADATTTVYQTINYAENAEVTFKTSGAGQTLVMDKVVDNNVTAKIAGEGTVEFAGGASLNSLELAESSALTVSSDVTTGSLTNAGAVTVTSGGTLTMGTAAGDGSLTLAGGSLVASSGTLATDISVTASSSLAGNADGLILNSAITMDYGTSLNLANAGTVSIGDNFSLMLDYAVTAGDYTIFTQSDNDFSSSLTGKFGVQDGLSEELTYTWSYGVDGSVSLTVKDYEEGTDLDLGGDDASTEHTTSTDEVYTNVDISGDQDTSFTGTGSVTSDSLDKSGTGNLNVGTDVTADSVTVEGGSILVTEDGALTSGNITVNAANGETASLAQASEGAATLVDDTLSSAAVTKAAVTVTGDASLVDTTIDANSTLDVQKGDLNVTGSSTIAADTTITENAAVVAGNMTVVGTDAGTAITMNDDGSITTNGISNTTVSNAELYVTSTGSVISSTSLENTQVYLAAGGNLTLANTTINANTTFATSVTRAFVAASEDEGYHLTGTTVIEASTEGGNLTGTDSLNYSVNTFANAGTVSVEGTLTINLVLTDTEYDAFEAWKLGDDATTLTLTIEGVDSYEDGSLLVITFSDDGDTPYYYVWGDFVTTGDTGGSLVVTLEQFNVIPEPSTATLSLLALAGLLARRRRSRTV